jgi:hypothetical protein
MAKGIRSKVKRANRTRLRKEIFLPNIKKRQETLHKQLVADLKSKGGNSIQNLRSKLMPVRGKAVDDKMDAEGVGSDDEDEDEEEEQVLDGLGENVDRKALVEEAQNVGKKRGSKPRINPNKELVWFK